MTNYPSQASRFATIFANETLVRVLGWFLMHPDEERYQRELAEELDLGLFLVQRELERLVTAGLVRRTARGRQVFYRAEREHPAFDDLRNVFVKTVAVTDRLREALRPAVDRIRLAFLFGSLAKGDAGARSDLDLLVVGETGLSEVSRLVGPVARGIGMEPNPITYSPEEFTERLRRADHFLTSVIAGPKTWIVGDDDELDRLAG